MADQPQSFLLINPPTVEPSIIFNATNDRGEFVEEVVKISASGKVTVNPKWSMDDAAKLFWDAVANAHRPALTKRLEEAKELLKHFCPAPGHNLPPNCVPAKIERFLAS